MFLVCAGSSFPNSSAVKPNDSEWLRCDQSAEVGYSNTVTQQDFESAPLVQLKPTRQPDSMLAALLLAFVMTGVCNWVQQLLICRWRHLT